MPAGGESRRIGYAAAALSCTLGVGPNALVQIEHDKYDTKNRPDPGAVIQRNVSRGLESPDSQARGIGGAIRQAGAAVHVGVSR